MDEKENQASEIKDTPSDNDWVTSMKDEMEEYIEEQGIYIRQ